MVVLKVAATLIEEGLPIDYLALRLPEEVLLLFLFLYLSVIEDNKLHLLLMVGVFL